MQTVLNPASLASLLPAVLLDLTMPTDLYALAAEGDALLPRIRHGQIVVISPAVAADPAGIEPGSIVLSAVSTDASQPHRYDRPALFVLNADRDLTGGRATVPRGSYLVLGLVRGE